PGCVSCSCAEQDVVSAGLVDLVRQRSRVAAASPRVVQHTDVYTGPLRPDGPVDCRDRTAHRSEAAGVEELETHDARAPVHAVDAEAVVADGPDRDRKSTRLNSSHGSTSYAVFCLKKKTEHAEPRRAP